MHFAVKGRGLAPEKLERAIAPSVEKYGSAFGNDCQDGHDYPQGARA